MLPSPYHVGYLAAHALGTRQQEGGVVRMPARVYGEGSEAAIAFSDGVADSISDRTMRLPTDRVSRAHPPWRQI